VAVSVVVGTFLLVPYLFVSFGARAPKSVLARHYTDFSPEKLKEIYEKAELEVLN
jgi:hypothetical protein